MLLGVRRPRMKSIALLVRALLTVLRLLLTLVLVLVLDLDLVLGFVVEPLSIFPLAIAKIGQNLFL